MELRINRELFQWEAGRYIYIDYKENEEKASHVQFFNKNSSNSLEVPVIDGKAKIPDPLLKEKYPITAIVCINNLDEKRVLGRKNFNILSRPKPIEYKEQEENNNKNKDGHIIFDGGVEL